MNRATSTCNDSINPRARRGVDGRFVWPAAIVACGLLVFCFVSPLAGVSLLGLAAAVALAVVAAVETGDGWAGWSLARPAVRVRAAAAFALAAAASVAVCLAAITVAALAAARAQRAAFDSARRAVCCLVCRLHGLIHTGLLATLTTARPAAV